MIDFRSDTFTKPSPEMLETMFNADVGDDVFSEDPTVNKLEAITAEMFGMNAGLFCPSGTMTNQVAIKCHTQPGDEVICDKLSHVYIYEGGGIAFNSGAQVKPLEGDRGRIDPELILSAINIEDIHKPVTSLVSLENTSNRGGGSYYDISVIKQIKDLCIENGLKLHLDGARLFNAISATGTTPQEFGEIFDSISLCFSKGLGAPVGSVLLGNRDFIKKARRVRKVFGGGMRQAGYLAAAGLYALEHNLGKLAIDHQHAKRIAEALLKRQFIGKMMPVDTNIIIFEVLLPSSPQQLAAEFEKWEIRVMPISTTQIRMVLHLDITSAMVDKTIFAIENIA